MKAYLISTKKEIRIREMPTPLPPVIELAIPIQDSGSDPNYVPITLETEKFKLTTFHLETVTDIAVYWERRW
jgi:hypothetical protein